MESPLFFLLPFEPLFLAINLASFIINTTSIMDAEEDFDIDPAIAAAMGFGGFGAQKSQKRKFNANDGFVDPNLGKASAAHGTGANNMPLRDRKEKSAKVASEEASEQMAPATTAHAQSSGSGSVAAYDPQTQESPSLEALRFGVRNVRGDMVYFSKSFLEDPWAELKPQ